MKLTPIVPPGSPKELASPDELRALISGWSWPTRGWVLSLVATPGGKFVGSDGGSKSIGTKADRACLLGNRYAADLVVTSAITARREAYRRSRLTPLLLISRSGRFDGIPAIFIAADAADQQPVYVASRRKPRFPAQSEIVWLRWSLVGIYGLSKQISKLGFNRVLAETGPTLSRRLINIGAISELRLNVVQLPAGELDPIKVADAALTELGVKTRRLVSADLVDDTLVTRWAL